MRTLPVANRLATGRSRGLPGCPNLDRGSREAEVGFEPRTFRKSHRELVVVGGKCKCITVFIERTGTHAATPHLEDQETVFVRPLTSVRGEMAQWLEHEFTDRKVRDSNPPSASQLSPSSHVIVCGSINYQSVSVFMHAFVNADRGRFDKNIMMLFMSETNPDTRLKALLKRESVHATFLRGDATSPKDLKRAKKLTARTPLTSISRHFLQRLQPSTDGVTGTPSWKAYNTKTPKLFVISFTPFCQARFAEAVIVLSDGQSSDPAKDDWENIMRVVSVKNLHSKCRILCVLTMMDNKVSVKCAAIALESGFFPLPLRDTGLCSRILSDKCLVVRPTYDARHEHHTNECTQKLMVESGNLSFKQNLIALMSNIPGWREGRTDEFDRAICTTQLKLGLMSLNCLARGASTLLTNLMVKVPIPTKLDETILNSATEVAANGYYTLPPSHCLTFSVSFSPFTWLCKKSPLKKKRFPAWIRNYFRGTRYGLYTVKFSPSFDEMPFQTVVSIAMQNLQLLLVAVHIYSQKDTVEQIVINPGTYLRINSQQMRAIVLADSFLHAQHSRPVSPFLGLIREAQSPSFRQPYVLLEPRSDCFRETHSFANQSGFHERLS
ncbi:hypothetical protein T265_08288 [Opisthorchis viverrini]|uniref:Uncharacterized protein n=1 Tax=Opisthorchis viverrini TaxID=6198 RepID=A0A074ZE43_OPIVI|nr:hypothetical protein T265_08288 [Opisthorchis viverrini]KER23922.1 hypothetical protein T265_08288 [Opisthorchis viverrini]